MATFYIRGDGQIEASIRRRGYPKQCKTWATKTLAQQWAREIETQMDQGTFQAAPKAQGTLLRDVIKRYKKEIAEKAKDPDAPRICDCLSDAFGDYVCLAIPK